MRNGFFIKKAHLLGFFAVLPTLGWIFLTNSWQIKPAREEKLSSSEYGKSKTILSRKIGERARARLQMHPKKRHNRYDYYTLNDYTGGQRTCPLWKAYPSDHKHHRTALEAR